MSATSIQKADIDNKLEREKNNLLNLNEALNKSNTNTTNMLTILQSFENRLRKLENTVEPVYNETEMLRRRQENIEKTMVTLDNVLGYYHVGKEVEEFIKEGPHNCGLEKYLSIMDRLVQAHNYFNKHNPTSLELTDVIRVYDDGKEALVIEFRTLLGRHCRPVPPVMVLDMISTDEELQGSDDIQLEHLPEKILTELSLISTWLFNNTKNTEYMKDYTRSRSSMLIKSLQGLKDHMKTSTGNSSISLFSMANSPAAGGKGKTSKDTPARKSVRKMAEAIKRHLSHSFKRRAVITLMQSPFDPGNKRQGSHAELPKEENLDVEVDIYITELSALLKLIQSEAQLMSGIIADKHHRSVFDNIIQEGLDSVIKNGELLAVNAKKSIAKHDFINVLSVFPVLKHLRSIKPEFDLTLEGCATPTRAKLTSLLSTLGSTAAKALEEFALSIKTDPEKASMPKDGTVHELTNRTIIFLEPLQDYADTAGAMLLLHGEQAAPSEAVDPKKSKMRLADYITKTLSALGLNLTIKAETYSDPTLRPVFMLNNYHYILKSLKRSGLLDLIHTWNKDVGQFYEDRINEQKKLYSESWSRVMHYITEVHEPISQQRIQAMENSKLKDKEKQNIKDKFSGFNKELEDILKIQKGYAIPDPELREQMKKDNKDFIIPAFRMFLDKFKRLNFTKNPEKYIKYSVQDVAEVVDKLFDMSA
ncbi:exocyst complex component 7-like isoform X1 [Crassostrea angulata]|uniref:exocyst complex component 7-like isoform X1 n=1 Tax=Magallana angulata TaxID=2784310 RepID=UPI0022B1BC55|nr:exocyst complex component 7-like isoform X1 [Crassostrea angulata]